jgi:hypothetical protein
VAVAKVLAFFPAVAGPEKRDSKVGDPARQETETTYNDLFAGDCFIRIGRWTTKEAALDALACRYKKSPTFLGFLLGQFQRLALRPPPVRRSLLKDLERIRY